VYRIAVGGRTYDPPVCLLKLPAKPGDTWTTELSGKGQPRKTIYTYRGEEEVEVPAGKFKALKIESEMETGKSVRATFWYVAGIGMVKSSTKFGDTERVYALKSFTAGK
jgi:hypothetical protein